MLSSSHLLRLIALVSCVAVLPSSAVAQEPLQFNVSYTCQDGFTRITTRCEKNARGGEVCFWREEKNGQLIGEGYGVRGQWARDCRQV